AERQRDDRLLQAQLSQQCAHWQRDRQCKYRAADALIAGSCHPAPLFALHDAPIEERRGRIVVNVVGGVVVFTVSAVVPIVVARATLALVMSLMSPTTKQTSDH